MLGVEQIEYQLSEGLWIDDPKNRCDARVVRYGVAVAIYRAVLFVLLKKKSVPKGRLTS